MVTPVSTGNSIDHEFYVPTRKVHLRKRMLTGPEAVDLTCIVNKAFGISVGLGLGTFQ